MPAALKAMWSFRISAVRRFTGRIGSGIGGASCLRDATMQPALWLTTLPQDQRSGDWQYRFYSTLRVAASPTVAKIESGKDKTGLPEFI
jgi:hypothetical protein